RKTKKQRAISWRAPARGVAMFARTTLVAVGLAFALATSFAQPAPSDPFYQAIRNDDLSAIRGLVAAHGTEVRDAAGLTPLMLAAASGSDNAAELLLDAGADVKAARDGITALHLAWHSETLVRLLLDRGADVNAKSQLGATPLVVAASAN